MSHECRDSCTEHASGRDLTGDRRARVARVLHRSGNACRLLDRDAGLCGVGTWQHGEILAAKVCRVEARLANCEVIEVSQHAQPSSMLLRIVGRMGISRVTKQVPMSGFHLSVLRVWSATATVSVSGRTAQEPKPQ